jgi:hypothetical protein
MCPFLYEPETIPQIAHLGQLAKPFQHNANTARQVRVACFIITPGYYDWTEVACQAGCAMD